MLVPNIIKICCGRKVGYEFENFDLSKKLKHFSY